jgi:drug/metabolite transporter (DMT)-like permease
MALLVDLGWFGAVPSAAQWVGMGCIVVAVLGHRLSGQS